MDTQARRTRPWQARSGVSLGSLRALNVKDVRATAKLETDAHGALALLRLACSVESVSHTHKHMCTTHICTCELRQKPSSLDRNNSSSRENGTLAQAQAIRARSVEAPTNHARQQHQPFHLRGSGFAARCRCRRCRCWQMREWRAVDQASERGPRVRVRGRGRGRPPHAHAHEARLPSCARSASTRKRKRNGP